jgi:HSP20 family protein
METYWFLWSQPQSDVAIGFSFFEEQDPLPTSLLAPCDGAVFALIACNSRTSREEVMKRRRRPMRGLVPWRPFQELERAMRNWDLRFPRLFEGLEEEELMPPVESFVKDGTLVVRADVPGLDPKDIEISVLHDVLTIKGERKAEKEVKEKDYLRREVSHGSFERRMSLPEGAAADKIQATFKNGVVEVSIPLPKGIESKMIPLEVEAEKKVDIEKK